MSIFSPQRKVRSSYNLLKDFEYYLPDIKGMFILLLLLLAGALIGNFVVLAFSAIPGAEGLADEYSLLLSYPVMFIPAMIYAVNKSRFNQGFDMEEAVPLDRNNFGKTGFAALALMSVVVTLAAGFITDPISKLLPPTPEWFERLNEKMLTGTPLVITLISVSVFAPLFEEWLCSEPVAGAPCIPTRDAVRLCLLQDSVPEADNAHALHKQHVCCPARPERDIQGDVFLQ